MANLYFELKSFGHPDFVSVQCTQFLQCSANEKDADGMVSVREKNDCNCVSCFQTKYTFRLKT